MVTFAETRLSSEAGKGGGSIGYGRFVLADAEGRKHAVGDSEKRLFLWRRGLPRLRPPALWKGKARCPLRLPASPLARSASLTAGGVEW